MSETEPEIDTQSSLRDEFKLIGNTYSIGRAAIKFPFKGPIVASYDAFYLLIDQTPKQSLFFALQLPTLAQAESLRLSQSKDKVTTSPYETNLSELPSALIYHPYWPIKRSSGRVFVIPREAIEKIVYDPWGSYSLVCGDELYQLSLHLLSRGSVMRFLSEAGWDELRDDSGIPSLWLRVMPFLAGIAGGLAGLAIRHFDGGRISADECFLYLGVGCAIGLVSGLAIHIFAWRGRV